MPICTSYVNHFAASVCPLHLLFLEGFEYHRQSMILLSRLFRNLYQICSLDKLINQQEGKLAYKVINGTFLLNDFLNHGEVRHQIQLRNIGDLRIPLYTATQSQLFVRYRATNTRNGLSGDLRSSSSLCTFKNKLRQLYLSLLSCPPSFSECCE